MMSYTIVEDGDFLQIRATIESKSDLTALIETLTKQRDEWPQPAAVKETTP